LEPEQISGRVTRLQDFHDRSKGLVSYPKRLDRNGTHPPFCLVGTEGSFPGNIEAGVLSWPSTSTSTRIVSVLSLFPISWCRSLDRLPLKAICLAFLNLLLRLHTFF